MSVADHNREAWDRYAREGIRWSVPVTPEEIARARSGQWAIYLTEEKPTPRHWFPEPLDGVDILCLASGGGQQGPILAAAGANVTVYDNSPEQLKRDRQVAEREGLRLETVQGDMRDLAAFEDEQFDLVFHPVSNTFVPDVRPVWREAFRVLRPGGRLMSGFMNPIEYAFDLERIDNEQVYILKNRLPFASPDDLTPSEHDRIFGEGGAYEYSHTLTDQIGGQLAAGFLLADLFEAYRDDPDEPRYYPPYIATLALKPA